MTAIPVTRTPQAFDALYIRNPDGTFSQVTGGGSNGEDVGSLTEKVETLEALVENMENAMVVMQGEIMSMNDGFLQQIAGLAGILSGVEDQTVTNKNNIEAMTPTLITHTTKIMTMEGQISDLEGRVTALETP